MPAVLRPELPDRPTRPPEKPEADSTVDVVHQPSYARTIPIAFGLATTKGQLIWIDPPEGPLRRTVDGKTTAVASFFMAHSWNAFQRPGVCLRIRANDKRVYDVRSGTGAPPPIPPFVVDIGPVLEGPEHVTRDTAGAVIRFYDGIDNGIDPYILAEDGADAIAFNGIRGVFFENFDCEPYGGSIPDITITWTDAAAESDVAGTVPLLATDALGYNRAAGTPMCFDEVLNRFYEWYHKDFETDTVYIGAIDFTAGRQTSLALLTDKPDAGINNLLFAAPLPGTGLFLVRADDTPNNYWALLVEAETGKTVASLAHASGEEVNWRCALPFVGGAEQHYIAAGWIEDSSANLPIAFVDVNVSDPAISYLLAESTSGDGTPFHVTPGKADAEGTTFFIGQEGPPGAVLKATFTELNAPVITTVYTADTGFEITGLKYDAGEDLVSVSELNGTENWMRGIDAESGTVLWEVQFEDGDPGRYEVVPGGGHYNTPLGQGLTARLFPGWAILWHWFSNGRTNKLMAMSNGVSTDIGLMTIPFTYRGDHYDQATGTLYKGKVDEWLSEAGLRYEAGDVTQQEVITAFCTYDGGASRVPLLTLAQLEFDLDGASLDDTRPKGVLIDRDADLRDIILNVCAPWNIDRIDTATGVKFRRRGLNALYSADFSLVEGDFAVRDGTTLLASRRKSETELAREVTLNYYSNDAEYNVLPAKASRPTGVFELTRSLRTQVLSPPLYLTDGIAQILANRVHKRWLEAETEHEGTLRPKWLKAEPSDAVEMTVGGFTYVAQLMRVTKRPDHALEFRAENLQTEEYTPDDTPLGTPTVNVPTPTVSNPNTRHVFLDGPLLRYSHDADGGGLVQYHVMTGPEGWPGGVLYMRRASESSWTAVGELADVLPVVGVLTTVLAAPAVTFETDAVNTFTIRLLGGAAAEIISQTEDQYYEAQSYALIGGPGRWLAVTWRNRTVNADGTITFDTLFQGLRGTEPYQGTSAVGDLFVLIKPTYYIKATYPLTDLDQSIRFKAVAYGQSPSSVPDRAFTISGAAETPIAPGSLDAVSDGSDIDLTWQRSSRLYSPWPDDGDGSSGGLGADIDVYKVEILSGPGGSVIRTYNDVSGTSKTYPAADISSDFGVIPDNLTFRVSQKSSIIGIGYGHTATRSVALQ